MLKIISQLIPKLGQRFHNVLLISLRGRHSDVLHQFLVGGEKELNHNTRHFVFSDDFSTPAIWVILIERMEHSPVVQNVVRLGQITRAEFIRIPDIVVFNPRVVQSRLHNNFHRIECSRLVKQFVVELK